jgi:hypothetical protein
MGEIVQFDRIMINSKKARGRSSLLPKTFILLLMVTVALVDSTAYATQLKSSASVAGKAQLKSEMKMQTTSG